MRRLSPLLAGIACALALTAPAAQALPTGRVLVLLPPAGSTQARASAVSAFLARTGARAAVTVPEIGLVAARPPAGRAPAAFARALRAQGSVRSAQVEGTMSPRAVPNDPALTRPESASGVPPGTVMEWPAVNQRFQA